jgi:hypothetical protein
MPKLERPKRGDKIRYEWACAVVDAINELMHNPRVIPPLVVKDGAIGFGDNYLNQLVKTTSAITARSGTTMGTGTVKFESSPGGTLADAAGSNISRDVRSILGNPVPSGAYGYVAWVNGEWHLISADCSGNP